ncbi:hypothetical protein AXG93_2909s1070 [Marchantia polymorpha subsp. ruderalis]|uniref:Uncharacterized protein n=1 Tax=Marchantia polymorpha subsp. ruderalis TaxID=1480154 RepID=A0A176WCE0_MARPO|nr:hypothetical protein AXG93_2909s1070 [Marchantia polymorpha subsp. ruderalis]
MLRELKMRATTLMSGDGRSWRQVAKRLELFLSRSREAIPNLEAEWKRVALRLEESQRRAEKADAAHRQLRDETINKLRVRVEKCLRGFAL